MQEGLAWLKILTHQKKKETAKVKNQMSKEEEKGNLVHAEIRGKYVKINR